MAIGSTSFKIRILNWISPHNSPAASISKEIYTNLSFFIYFFELYAFIILTSTLVLGINYFVIITRPLLMSN